MPSANVDLVRSIFAAWERGDFGTVGWADPEIEIVRVGGLGPGSWRGVAGMAEGFRAILAAWENFRAEPEEYRELDDERVLVLIRFSGRGKTSGLELAKMRTQGANLFSIHDGKVTKLVVYRERERAFCDLGLPPETH
jgi:ketosteroid isomerase-like protein